MKDKQTEGWVDVIRNTKLKPSASQPQPAIPATTAEDVITAASDLAKIMAAATNDRYGSDTIWALLRLEEALRRLPKD